MTKREGNQERNKERELIGIRNESRNGMGKE